MGFLHLAAMCCAAALFLISLTAAVSMQLLLLPLLAPRSPSLLFADPRLIPMSPTAFDSEPVVDTPMHMQQQQQQPIACLSDGDDEGCKLLDGFAIVVQVSLATTAFLVLLYKRWRERPQRPVPIW